LSAWSGLPRLVTLLVSRGPWRICFESITGRRRGRHDASPLIAFVAPPRCREKGAALNARPTSRRAEGQKERRGGDFVPSFEPCAAAERIAYFSPFWTYCFPLGGVHPAITNGAAMYLRTTLSLACAVILSVISLSTFAASASSHRHHHQYYHHVGYDYKHSHGARFGAAQFRRHPGQTGSTASLASVHGQLAAKANEIVSSCGSTVISGMRPGARIAGTGHESMHASGRAVDIRGNPSCIYSHLHGWPGGYSVDYGAVQHVHVSLGGFEDGVHFSHGGSHHRHHRYT
jgi:hypothetical protein